jgi:hypothetical protein
MSTPSLTVRDQTTECLLYTAQWCSSGVLLSNESLWLTQERMASCLAWASGYSKHLNKHFEAIAEEELLSVLERSLDGVRGRQRKVEYFNLMW